MAQFSTSPVIHHEKKRRPLEIDLDIKGSDLYHSEYQQAILKTFTESMILKGLSPGTRKIYLQGFKRFLSHHTDIDINTLRYRELLHYVKAQAVIMHPTKLKQTISSIKFYYERTLGRNKMFFPLMKNKKASLFTLYLPFYDLKELINGIDSPGDKLLLFLVYHANLRLSDICRLPKEAKGIFGHLFHMPGNDELAIQYFQGLVAECNKQYHQNTYLFENNGHAHNTSTLKTKLFRILGHYRMEAIYQKQYQQILKHADLSTRTQAMYLNAFMKFLKYLNYKHPAFITNEDIRAYRALHRKKTNAHQNIMVSSFKFFFDKVHKRPVSRQILVRPRKDMHLSAYSSQSEDAAILGNATTLGIRNHQNHQNHQTINTKRFRPDLKLDNLFIMASPLRRRAALSVYTAKRNHSPP